MTNEPTIIRISKSRITEAARQAAAECTDDIRRCLAERGVEIEQDLRQLFLDTIHVKMLLSVLDVLNAGNYDFQEE
jgi:hypothetical protein